MIFLWICLGFLAWLVLPLPIALAVGRFMRGEVRVAPHAAAAAKPASSAINAPRVETAQVV